MKKIVSIVIALVLVLSMTSAFAYSTCATWAPSWECPSDYTYCGKGAIEVVPYVKVNTACGWEYQISDCAAAIRSDEVYFAIKLTVDAYPDAGWWSQAWIDFDSTGLSLNWDYEDGAHEYDFSDVINAYEVNWNGSYAIDAAGTTWDGIDPFADEEKVYYLLESTNPTAANTNWVDSEDDDFDLAAAMFVADVNAGVTCGVTPEYDVCATLNSEYDGYSWAIPGGQWGANFFRVGEYVIGFNGTFDKSGNFTGSFMVCDITEEAYLATKSAAAGGTTGVAPEMDNVIIYEVTNGKVDNVNTKQCSAAFAAKVNADFNMAACGLDTCITKKNIKNNFGWDDAQEDCFGWSTEGAATVNPECSVEIPKTGDVSVVAYAVMAIAAAAGMLKK